MRELLKSGLYQLMQIHRPRFRAPQIGQSSEVLALIFLSIGVWIGHLQGCCVSHRSSDLILEVPFFLLGRKTLKQQLTDYLHLIKCGSGESRWFFLLRHQHFHWLLIWGKAPQMFFVTLTFTLCYNFTSDFWTTISHRGEQLVPITRKAFTTWVTAHKKHSWDHQPFYLFFFQFLLIVKLMRYISFPWRSPGKQWSDSPFPSCFGQCWWYSTAKFCLIEASSMLLAAYFSHQTLIIWWSTIQFTAIWSLIWMSYIEENNLVPWAMG